jgi:hypothetical protein
MAAILGSCLLLLAVYGGFRLSSLRKPAQSYFGKVVWMKGRDNCRFRARAMLLTHDRGSVKRVVNPLFN